MSVDYNNSLDHLNQIKSNAAMGSNVKKRYLILYRMLRFRMKPLAA